MELNSALRDRTNKHFDRIGEVDLLVGIPSYNCESTIAQVVQIAAEGLKAFFPSMRSLILVSDGGSLDDTRERAQQARVPSGIKRIVTIYRGIPGKGTSCRAIFEAADRLGAKACCIFDADLRSITPEWVKLLLSPLLEDGYDFVAPAYLRHKYDGTVTNNIVYPLTRALYGLRLRQPIGGDFGFNGELAAFYAKQDVWGTHIAEFGIDIWMTTTAITSKSKICQANLGVKIHNPKDPASSLGPMFMQVIWTLFTLMNRYESTWKKVKRSTAVSTYNGLSQVPPEPIEVSHEKLTEELRDGFDHFGVLYKEVLSDDSFRQLQRVVSKGSQLSPQLWARVVYDFSVVFNRWERNRRKLVDILTPLYFGRTASIVEETKNMTSAQAEKVVEAQATIFEEEKPYLMERWEE